MASKTEAKIKFEADAAPFTQAISQASRTLTELRSALKLNAAQLAANGNNVEDLSRKQELLAQKAQALADKKAALTEKLRLAEEQLGANSSMATNLRASLNYLEVESTKLQTEIDGVTSALARQQGGSADHRTALERLSDTISDQEQKLDRLKQAYSSAVLEYGKNSREARGLAAQISSLSGELSENRRAMDHAELAADSLDQSLDDTADSAGDASEGFTVMKGVLADLISDGIQAAADAFQELMTASSEASASFQAQTGASAQEMEAFSDSIESLYRQNFGESLQDIADAMAEVKRQTGEIDPSRLEKMTANAITLQDTFGYDYAETIRAVNMLMDQFGLTSEQAFNFVAKGAQEGLDKNGDLLDTINEYSSYYQAQGYSADEFYNSLKNGADAGTFSVDKLGDAMKEFGIRAKDTGTTTSDGFALLGYTAEASAEEIAKTEEEIAKLERNLRYATMEQESFNSKTSELTRLKNADKIQEYSEQLEEAKATLAGMTSESGNTGKSLEELQARFAAGGQAARDATAEVLEALYALDDPIQQNAAGVALFGTMWEDLGADGVRALMDVSGAAVTTTSAMQQLTAVKYSDIGSALSEVGRTLESEVLQPIVNEVTPAILDLSDQAISSISAFSEGGLGAGIQFVGNIVAGLMRESPALLQSAVDTAANLINGLAQGAAQGVPKFLAQALPMLMQFSGQLRQNAGQLIDAGLNLIMELGNGLIAGIPTLIQTVPTIVSNIAGIINDNAPKLLMTAGTLIWNLAVGLIQSIPVLIQEAPKIVSAVVDVITAFNWLNLGKQIITGLKNGITNMIGGVKTAAVNVKNNVVSAVQNLPATLKNLGTNAMNGIRTAFSAGLSAARNVVSGGVSGIKNLFSSGLNGAKSVVFSVLTAIQSKFTSVINGAKNVVRNGINAIKGFFKFSWSLPKLKLPHISISGSFSLAPPRVPKFSISWYREGGILEAPTIFGRMGSTLLGGGEAGPEAVAPIDVLQDYVASAVERTISTSISSLAAAVQAMADRPVYLQINGRTFAAVTAGDTDDALGTRQALMARGLCL